MEKQYVKLKNNQAQSELKKGDKGYIHSYVRGANGTPYAVVVSNKVIDLVSFYNLEPCENFTDNLPQCLKQSSETAFAIHGVTAPLLWKEVMEDFYIEHDRQISNGDYKGKMILVFIDWLEKNYKVPARNGR